MSVAVPLALAAVDDGDNNGCDLTLARRDDAAMKTFELNFVFLNAQKND